MQDLHLALKHEWFVVFKEGDKPVEVRERAEAEGRQMLRNIANYGYESFLYWATTRRCGMMYINASTSNLARKTKMSLASLKKHRGLTNTRISNARTILLSSNKKTENN